MKGYLVNFEKIGQRQVSWCAFTRNLNDIWLTIEMCSCGLLPYGSQWFWYGLSGSIYFDGAVVGTMKAQEVTLQ